MQSVTDLIEREYGNRNWVLARRTQNIVARYGPDVITLSNRKLDRLEKQFELETADRHPAYPWLARQLGSHVNAVNLIRGLREEGFRIEKIYVPKK